MLAKRIIPCLDVKDGRVVKGVNFVELRDAGDPVEQAQVYDREGADELVFLDITASHERRDIVIDMVRRVADSVFIPFTVGGGIRTVDDMRGAAAGRRRQGVDQLAGRAHARAGHRGRDALRQPVHRRGDRRQAGIGDRWEVFIDGGRMPTGLEVVAWARRGRSSWARARSC